jgi:hypothetical protein
MRHPTQRIFAAVVHGTLCFKKCQALHLLMRPANKALTLMLMLLLLTVSPWVSSTGARSVHSTSTVDLFPQGSFTDAASWTVGAETSFTQEAASHTESMVADQRLTMLHTRPLNLDTMTVWSSTSPTDSNYSTGAPDGASTWSTGPEIELTDFDITGLSNYQMYELHMVGVFQIPDALSEDTVRISVEHGDGFDLLKTFAHTQGNVDYINNTAYRVNITGLMDWTWDDIAQMVFTLDYVSAGGVDDSRLVVDALGLDITVRTPWYGGEVAYASSEFSGHDMPVMGLDLAEGTTDNLALDTCGLKPTVEGTSGQWTSEPFAHPPEQVLGRVHHALSEGESQNITVELATSSDGTSFGAFAAMTPNTLLPQGEAYQLRFSVTDACLSSVWVDVNDPSLSVAGRVFGSNAGIDADYSRWLVFVNDELVSNEPMALGTFTHEWPIGGYLQPGSTSLTVSIRAWFTWDSDGAASHTALELTQVDVSGGYAIQYDEDPSCEGVGDQVLSEDNGGIILPFLSRCSDDRATNEDLSVTFTNTDDSVVAVDLAEGDVRLRLLPEASGQSVIGITVTDPAGNAWSQTFTVDVAPVDDPPVVVEFPPIIPVEHELETVINMTWSDIDSPGLVTASTNRSWASVDLTSNVVKVTPPTVGFHTVLLSVCDQTTCTDREIDLEVMALPDLMVESIDFGTDDISQGDIITMRVLVRNQGQADATMVSVRCQTDQQLIDVQTIAIIQPGELQSVRCDWQVPEDARVLRFSAVVDRGLEIPEGDETNNAMEELVAINERADATGDGAESGVAAGVVSIGIVVLALGLLGLIIFMMPPKIKKIE